jgi:hypothetical protein
MVPCSRCRAPVDAASAYYSEHGELMCARCNAAADIAATETRAVGYIQYLAYANLAVGAFSLIFNPFMVISMMAVINAVVITMSLQRDDWYRQRMGASFHAAGVCCLLGGVLGALPLIFLFLHVAFGMAKVAL